MAKSRPNFKPLATLKPALQAGIKRLTGGDGRVLFLGLAIAIFVFLRIWRLNQPTETVFDEVYFPVMAAQYLRGESFFDIHPPLGKLIIALGEMALGNRPIGWRIMPLLAGLAILPAAYRAMLTLFGSRLAALLAAFLIALDGLFIVYARTGLMDGFIILFGLAAIWLVWRFRQRRLEGQSAWGHMLAAGLAAGLALAVKWIGAGFLPLVALTAAITIWQAKRRPRFSDWVAWFIAFAVIPAIVYTLPFIANWSNDFWPPWLEWHRQSWGYNINLDATHPYSSKWWSWPFLIRPIWFYYQSPPQGIVGVDAIGHPLIWWLSTVAVVYTILILLTDRLARWRRQPALLSADQVAPLFFLTAGWAIFYLPWIAVGRVLFLYHYFSSYLFALLLSAYWLSEAVKLPNGRRAVDIFLLAALVVGLLFAPIWIGYPINQNWFQHLMWFKSWI